MKYLLDTHYLLWSIADSRKISKPLIDVISDPGNEIFVSTISFWEISLKTSLGRLQITGFSPGNLPELCLQIGFKVIDLSATDSSTYHLLKAVYHKDPFDRMLIWQAIQNGYTFISMDEKIKKYRSEGLKLFRHL